MVGIHISAQQAVSLSLQLNFVFSDDTVHIFSYDEYIYLEVNRPDGSLVRRRKIWENGQTDIVE